MVLGTFWGDHWRDVVALVSLATGLGSVVAAIGAWITAGAARDAARRATRHVNVLEMIVDGTRLDQFSGDIARTGDANDPTVVAWIRLWATTATQLSGRAYEAGEAHLAPSVAALEEAVKLSVVVSEAIVRASNNYEVGTRRTRKAIANATQDVNRALAQLRARGDV